MGDLGRILELAQGLPGHRHVAVDLFAVMLVLAGLEMIHHLLDAFLQGGGRFVA